jgi:hypothetical protein
VRVLLSVVVLAQWAESIVRLLLSCTTAALRKTNLCQEVCNG